MDAQHAWDDGCEGARGGRGGEVKGVGGPGWGVGAGRRWGGGVEGGECNGDMGLRGNGDMGKGGTAWEGAGDGGSRDMGWGRDALQSIHAVVPWCSMFKPHVFWQMQKGCQMVWQLPTHHNERYAWAALLLVTAFWEVCYSRYATHWISGT